MALKSFKTNTLNTVGDVNGLVHIETRALTATSLENFNDVFSSIYDNYKILLTSVASTSNSVSIRLRVAGADNSTTNSYVRQNLSVNGTSVAGSRGTSNIAKIADVQSTLISVTTLEVFRPFVATASGFLINTLDASSGAILNPIAITHNQTVSYDGFSFIVSTGSITGQVSIYAYAKA